MATKAKTLQVKDKEKDDKAADAPEKDRSEEHTSELQSPC